MSARLLTTAAPLAAAKLPGGEHRGNPNELNFKPGVRFAGTPTPHNPLTIGMHLMFPQRVSPQMLEGLREPQDSLTRLTRSALPLNTMQQLNNPNLTNEQMAEIALHEIMARR